MKQISFSDTSVNKQINPEQFNQIIVAILDGKYSWACLLILRFAGYNPLLYIPYRTYNRLMKENEQIGRPTKSETNSVNLVNACAKKSNSKPSHNCLNQITDLSYIEEVSEQHIQVKGGNLEQQLDGYIREYSSLKVELVKHKIKEFMFAASKFLQRAQ